MPSVVSCVSFAVARSRTQRFQSLIYAARLPSGDTTSSPLRRPKPPPPLGGVIPKLAASVEAFLDPSAGFIITYSLPVGVRTRYQNRPSGKNVGCRSPARSTRGDVL